ncbi:ATP-binding protein [Azospirillum sp. SYSU D00513]|uniref:sensor histidine kinase n=1 Tax=Azospirillum sp. SYSU D00513 TaxID=2812561 RepID=UPI001A966A87|nr:ATP-binding protein [Azospirillum sp. SYSU D00513]
MRQVFSRWPSLAETSAEAPPKPDVLPAWMTAVPARRWPVVARDLAVSALLVFAPAALAALSVMQPAERREAALLMGAGALLSGILAVLLVMRLRRDLADSRRQCGAFFERAGISMWREDWTAVGEAVMALRRAGVSDLESYFANRPDELRALKARVMIRDVNAFTLEETGAPGKEAFIGPLDRLLPETDQTFVQWLVAFGRGDRFFRSEAHLRAADGAELDALFTAMLPRDLAGFSDIVVTSVDITAYRKAQARLAAVQADVARTSRISTANAFSASVAHEVNSPLAAILANAQAAQRLLRQAQPDIAEATAALQDVVSQASRARDVVARITSHFSKSSGAFAPVDVVQAARNANLLVETDLRRHGAVVHLAAPDDLPPAMADLVQIQQVFVNLMLNAAQAMAERPGRRDITVTLRLDRSWIAANVTDTGPGVAAERRAQIFEPFHSTKPGGMGMGLAICRNCLDAHGGDIWVDEAPGGGAAFHFKLPVAHG